MNINLDSGAVIAVCVISYAAIIITVLILVIK